jgi:hypothetical protein
VTTWAQRRGRLAVTHHRGMALRHCPSCSALRNGDRCTACGWTHSRLAANRKPRTRADLGTNEWKRRSRNAREHHVATHGLWCPGWPPVHHPAHNVDDIGMLALHELDGPGSHPDRCVVLCQHINSSIGAPT